MRKLSKLMSLLLVLVMMFMMVPVSAMAKEGEATDDENVIVVLAVEGSSAGESGTVLNEVPIIEEQTLKTTVVEEEPIVEQTVKTTVVDEEPVIEKAIEVPIVEEQQVAQEAIVQELQVVQEAIVEEQAMGEGTVAVQNGKYLYLYDESGGQINVLATNTGNGYAYDAITNALSLNNFTGQSLLARLLGENFAVVIYGTNTLTPEHGFAVDVDGNLNLSGTGTLIINEQTFQPESMSAEQMNYMAGGIHANGNLVINSGNYDITVNETGYNPAAYGILAGESTLNTTGIQVDPYRSYIPGNLIINGGNFDLNVTANTIPDINNQEAEMNGLIPGGAYGMYAFGNQIINGGHFNIVTNSKNYLDLPDLDAAGVSKAFSSIGIGAYETLMINGGYIRVRSNSETDNAAALYAGNLMIIRNGILDLCAKGGAEPLAIYGQTGTFISPCYGDVDLTASCLYLEPRFCKDKCCDKTASMCTLTQARTYSNNPKTGVQDESADALFAVMTLMILTGFAIVTSKRGARS